MERGMGRIVLDIGRGGKPIYRMNRIKEDEQDDVVKIGTIRHGEVLRG
jgi:hypothetical protein